eukprot:9110354-Pyramimonas_sp.AAC.1
MEIADRTGNAFPHTESRISLPSWFEGDEAPPTTSTTIANPARVANRFPTQFLMLLPHRQGLDSNALYH